LARLTYTAPMLPALRRVFVPWIASPNDYEKQVRSQNGEDGILVELFSRLQIHRGYFVEFGVQDGAQCNAAHLALDRQWAGVMIEGNPDYAPALLQRYQTSATRVVSAFVTAENIAGLFEAASVPADFDLLSIDIDGNDYWVWRALHAYRPKVVVIEYNAVHPPPERWVMRYDPAHVWDGSTYYGASLASLVALGESMGYALLCTDVRGVNAFFVRREFAAAVRFALPSVERAYHPVAFQGSTGGIGHPPGEGSFERI
jgi:hypothetical protein